MLRLFRILFCGLVVCLTTSARSEDGAEFDARLQKIATERDNCPRPFQTYKPISYRDVGCADFCRDSSCAAQQKACHDRVDARNQIIYRYNDWMQECRRKFGGSVKQATVPKSSNGSTPAQRPTAKDDSTTKNSGGRPSPSRQVGTKEDKGWTEATQTSSFQGKWNGSASWLGFASDLTLDLKVQGKRVTGTWFDAKSGKTFAINTTLDGNSFTFPYTGQMGESCTGTVTLTGPGAVAVVFSGAGISFSGTARRLGQ